MSDAESPKETVSPKKGWSRRKKVLVFLLAIVLLGAGFWLYRDRPARYVQSTDFDYKVDYQKGEILDYRYAFNAAQDAEFSPAEENGWRLILQALGPKALEQRYNAETIPWEEFPTNEATKDWFNGHWTKLCEKFHLDPHARPTMLDRPSLLNYVGKHGLTGAEPEPDPEDFQNGVYVENYEKRPAKSEASFVETTLLAGPWTAEQYPNAAKWLDENGDYFDMLAKAARSPKLGCWHFPPEPTDGGFICLILPDVQATRGFARNLAIRANYRVGQGDISGAIDDVETITRFARPLLENPRHCLVERLVGIACVAVAANVPLYANPDAAPSPEELARVAELWSSFYPAGRLDELIELGLRGEHDFSCGTYSDILTARRKGMKEASRFFMNFTGDTGFSPLAALVAIQPVNDAKAFRIFKELTENLGRMSREEEEAFFDEIRKPSSLLFTSPERQIALVLGSLLLPAINAATEAYNRSACMLNEATIMAALMAYKEEHGAFPPAFSADDAGAPLHSWRVLILPYLGDDARALYDELRLDEPWDSEHNRAFHDKAPSVFQCPTAKLAPGETVFSFLLGNDGFFDESGAAKDLDALPALPGRDVMRQPLLVERPEPVCWMTPDAELKLSDLTADGSADVKKLFEPMRHPGGINVVTLGGAASFVRSNMTDVALDAFLRGLPEPKDEDVEAQPAETGAAEEENAEETSEPESALPDEPNAEL